MGKRNHNYKGGHIASNGYKIQYVGKNHYLADIRGYAYEHRLIAEIKIGRKLRNGEQVHHIDHNKLNNNPDNLKVTKNRPHHAVEHRKKDSKSRLPNEKNIDIICSCGCESVFKKYDSYGRLRIYVSGHNPTKTEMRVSIINLINSGIQNI